MGGRSDVDTLLRGLRPAIERIAARMVGRLPPNVERGELVQVGLIGAWLAMPRFDATRGASRSTFLGRAAQHAMLGFLRSTDWASEGDRAKIRAIDAAERALRQRDGRRPTDVEHAAAAGVSLANLHRLRDVVHVPLSDADADTLPADGSDPAEILEELETEALVTAGLRDLPAEWRVAVLPPPSTLDVDNAVALGIPPTRISYLRRQAAAFIRRRLAAGSYGVGSGLQAAISGAEAQNNP